MNLIYFDLLMLGVTYFTCVYHTFYKNCVIYNKATSLQLCVGNKPWASIGNVHVRLRLSKRAAHWVWLERVNNISASCLVDELEGDLVCEWPLEDVVKLSTHHHKEQ